MNYGKPKETVVICFHFSIFEPLETANHGYWLLQPLL